MRSATVLATLTAVPVALIVGVGVFWALDRVEDTGPVQVAAPPDVPGADAPCAKLLGALPRSLAGEGTRPVTDAPHRVVAWGDPPIVLRCGVDKPRFDATAQVIGVDGVEWVYRTDGDTIVWTTITPPLHVEVRADKKYSGDELLNPLAGPIKSVR